jgi:GNAT superfamily N-acetyltransferase
MPDVEIRDAITAEAERLAAVYRRAYAENRRLGFPAKAGSATAADVRAWISDYRVAVATVDGDLVGAVRLERTDAAHVVLSRLAVDEGWKGEGVGTHLLEHAGRLARSWGYDAVQLTTPEDHPTLPDWYRRRGYERVGDYPLAYRDYDEILMEKRLE